MLPIALQEAVMVLRSVHKPYAVVGLLVATAVVPSACSDEFEGCKANRTCPPPGGGDNGGEAGGGNETGGSSGSSSGTSGAAGTDDGGGGGTGGSSTGGSGASGGEGGTDDGPPTVEAFTPSDGSSDVERDIEVTAELSEPVDEATVTETSVTLTGPDGEVAGTLSVDENVISFVPDRPFYLLGTYTFTLDDTVADLAGNTLEEPASAEFQVRDGRWGAITTPFGRSARYLGAFGKNAAGDIILAGGQPVEPSTTLWAAIYSASDNIWTPAESLVRPVATYTPSDWRGVGIDTERRAAVLWTTNSEHGWYRFSEENGWQDAGSLPAYPSVAVTSGGLATAVAYNSMMANARTMNTSTGELQPVTPVTIGGTQDLRMVASRERVAIFGLGAAAAGEEIDVAWRDPATGWEAADPVASAANIDLWSVSADDQGNIVLFWSETNRIWSRIYEPGEDSWTRPLLVSTTGMYPMALGEMSQGNVAAALFWDDVAYGAYYQAGVGWVQSSIVDLGELGGLVPRSGEFGVATAIDPRGNAIAVGRIGYRRYVPGDGWQSPVEHRLDLGQWRLWMAAAPDGTILAVTHDLTGDDELIPQAVRFE
jgi:hypothetical protein